MTEICMKRQPCIRSYYSVNRCRLAVFITLIILFASLFPLKGTAQVDFTGSFNSFVFQEVLSHMPGSGSNGYQPPTDAEINDFGLVFEHMKNGNYSEVQPILDDYGYQFYRFHHTAENPDTFYLIYEVPPITRGWGMYVIRENYDRNVHVQVPHPLFDTNTPQVGARSFVRHNMRFYSIAGAHRYANGPIGTNPVSDVARDHPSIFQRAHEVWSDTEALQLHGFNDQNPIYNDYPDVVISNGTTSPQPVLYTLADLLIARNISAGVYDEDTMNDLSLLAATQNPQGQWSAQNNRTFIHYEMARYLRELEDPGDMSSPINTVISTFGFAFQETVSGGAFYVGNAGTAPGGTDPDFENLGDAFDFFSPRELDGDVDLIITSDLNESENVFIGTNTAGYQLIIRPLEGTSPVVTFSSTSSNSSINGALVIGAESDNWSQLRRVRNLIIDGGSGSAGSSSNMTFRTSPNAASTNYFRILNAENVTFRNLNIEINQESFDAVLISNLRRDGVDYLTSDITFDQVYVRNTSRSSARSIIMRDVFDEPQSAPGLLTVKNSLIEAGRYGIWLREFGSDADIHNNEIRINETDGLGARGIYIEDTASENVTVNIHSNTFSQLSAGLQLYAIEVSAPGSMNVYNNMITGFEYNGTTASDDVYFYGILAGTPSATMTANIDFNTIRMNPLNYTGGEGWRYRGVQMNSSNSITAHLRNNIIILEDENPEVVSYGFFRFLAAGEWTSDYNNIFVTNPSASDHTFFGRWGGADGNVTSLTDWQNVSGQGANSISKTVEFISDDNLRLAGSSDGDQDLAGTPISGITTDIDGTQRDPVTPYMGAYEGQWLTTSAEYEAEIPKMLTLHQNYPNPFNPVTQIRFELRNQEHVTLEVYSILGQRVAILIDEVRAAGSHQVQFDATGLSTGIYIVQVTAGSERAIRKMTFIK